MISTIDMATVERLLVGGVLAVLALLVTFGPEIRDKFGRLRARGRSTTAFASEGSPALSSRIEVGTFS